MRLVVLGDPVEHSLSPLLHNAALRHVGLLGSYSHRRVDAAGMEQAVADIRHGDLDGANVTMPHKELAAALCDRLSATSAQAGAVNTLVKVGSAVVGHNTDVIGIQSAWRACGLSKDAPVLVLGAGGAAAAALIALGGRVVRVAARRSSAVETLLSRVAGGGISHPWGEPVAGAVLINATPIGMKGESLRAEVLEAASGVFDMAYGPSPTPAVRWAQANGVPFSDGRQMLLHQAGAAFELWTGHRAPLEAMAAAIAA